MVAVANNPKFAKKVGIPQSVGKDYEKADEGKKFKRGGKMSNCGTKRMKKGGMTGYHKMPDGSMMKDSDHKGMKAGGRVRGAGMAQRGVRPCKMR